MDEEIEKIFENIKGKDKPRKNHWTAKKKEEATKKINQEVYKRSRQAPLQIKLDDLAIYINDRITRRGISKGLVSIQEDLNKNILDAEKNITETLITSDIHEQYSLLMNTKMLIKVEVWTDIRFLMINRAITPGEITELIRRQMLIDTELDRWLESMSKAISARG